MAQIFSSLLDGHSQILQFPGYLKVYKLKRIFTSSIPKEIALLFTKTHPEYFDSRYEKFERWHKLGPNKNKFFKVNKKKFIDAFVKISDIKKNSKIEIIKNLHKAYFITRGMNTKKSVHYLSYTFIIMTEFIILQNKNLK